MDGSGDCNEKCHMVVAWCKQIKEHFEHRAKNQMAVFQLGARDGMKLT